MQEGEHVDPWMDQLLYCGGILVWLNAMTACAAASHPRLWAVSGQSMAVPACW
jgi:hypothetical protein